MNLSKSMKGLLFAIALLFLVIMAGLIGLLYIKTTRHLMDYDISVNKYTEQNKILLQSNMKQPDAIFIGNSITEQWSYYRANFMTENNYLNRGIGGETSPQLLLRFRRDVVDLKPKIVVIAAGINDIAENTGRYDPEFTFDNILSMTEIANQNGIKVILASLLPSTNEAVSWHHPIAHTPEKIADLNKKIKELALEKGYGYVDYFSALVGEDKGLKPEFTVDGVHINAEAYKVMEPLVKQEINKILSQKN